MGKPPLAPAGPPAFFTPLGGAKTMRVRPWSRHPRGYEHVRRGCSGREKALCSPGDRRCDRGPRPRPARSAHRNESRELARRRSGTRISYEPSDARFRIRVQMSSSDVSAARTVIGLDHDESSIGGEISDCGSAFVLAL